MTLSTDGSTVLAAGSTPSGEVSQALERLCSVYWPAIYAFLRRHGRSAHDAQDLTQSFILNLLRRGSLSTVEPARGRFRSFLLGALKHFLADDWRRANARKRDDGHIAFPLEGIDAEAEIYAAAHRAWWRTRGAGRA